MTLRSSAVALVIVTVATQAGAVELPERKAGLWSNTITHNAEAPVSIKYCSNAEVDRRVVQDLMAASDSCPKKELNRTANGYALNSRCEKDNYITTEQVDVTGDFQTALRFDFVTTLTCPPGTTGSSTTKIVIESRHIGDCEPGQTPGDVILPNGEVTRPPMLTD